VAEGVDARAVLAEGRISALVLTEAQPFADQMSAGLTVPALSANPETALFLYESCPPALTGEAADWRATIAADLPPWQLAAAAGAEVGTEIALIPVGQAFAALSVQIDARKVPSIASIRDFFLR
jgi:hypothetical protein